MVKKANASQNNLQDLASWPENGLGLFNCGLCFIIMLYLL